jgi:hypothetical protein
LNEKTKKKESSVVNENEPISSQPKVSEGACAKKEKEDLKNKLRHKLKKK